MLGFLLDRLGMEKQRGPGTSLKAQHKTGQMWVPELGQERRSRRGLQVSRDGPRQGGGVGAGPQGPRKCLANSPGKRGVQCWHFQLMPLLPVNLLMIS